MNGESFTEAYERFKGYQMKCPHHGFSEESLLSTLYRGVLPKYRLLLDTASNGHFLGQDVDEGLLLVENIAMSDCNYSEEYDRADRGISAQEEKHKKKLETLTDKLEKFLLVQQNQAHCISDENLVQKEEEVHYVGNQGGHQNQRGQQVVYYIQGCAPKTLPPPGFGSTQAHAGSDSSHDDDMKTMLQQIIQGQASGAVELNKKLAEIQYKVDGSHRELTRKVEELSSKVQHLEAQRSSSTSSASGKGILPGKPIQNPKAFGGAILSTHDCAVRIDDNEKAIAELYRLLHGTGVEHSPEKPKDHEEKQNANKEIASQSSEREETTKAALPPYIPALPFPGRFLTKAQKKVISVFRNDMSKIGVHLPNMGNMQEAHLQMKLIKDILANKERVAAILDFTTAPAPPLITPTSIPKLESQGKFTLPCLLGDLKLDDALVDSGANVNLISLAMVRRLGIKSLTSPSSSVMFGDASSKSPLGLVKDFPLKIGGCKVPIDLTVLDMVDENEVPLILGTPFLTTVGASIDFHKKLVTLHNVNSKVAYPMKVSTTSYCGTITIGQSSNTEDQVERDKAVHLLDECGEDILDGECLLDMFDEHIGRAQKEEACRGTKAILGKKAKMKEPQPHSLDPPLYSLKLSPLKLKDGELEFKMKCKGKPSMFSCAKTITRAKPHGDPTKLQSLPARVMTITVKGVQSFTIH